jgi:hypothetical protein
MRISESERQAIIRVLQYGKDYGYGNLIGHLQTAWARSLVNKEGMTIHLAKASVGSRGYSGYPFKMQDDLIQKGQWDDTGKAYFDGDETEE